MFVFCEYEMMFAFGKMMCGFAAIVVFLNF